MLYLMLWISAEQACDHIDVYVLRLTEKKTVLQSRNMLSYLFWSTCQYFGFSFKFRTSLSNKSSTYLYFALYRVTEVGRDLCRFSKQGNVQIWIKKTPKGEIPTAFAGHTSNLLIRELVQGAHREGRTNSSNADLLRNGGRAQFLKHQCPVPAWMLEENSHGVGLYGMGAAACTHPLEMAGAKCDTHSTQKFWTHLSRCLNHSLVVPIKGN